jgi:RNA polymerase sigma-70 factor (ECF subfamily)
MNYSDSELSERINKGDITVFEDLYRKYYSYLLFVAYHIVRNNSDAEEVVSDVFVKLWENRKEIKIDFSVKSYIIKAVRNHALNFIRKKKPMDNVDNSLDLQEWMLFVWDADYPLGQLYRDDLLKIIRTNISLLPESCREIFLLSRSNHMSYNEIADFLGISVNTVKMQIKIALSRLREAMKDYLPIILFLVFN